MSGHKKNDSTCDSAALLRGQSHSRESSGASNLSVKYTITQSSDGSGSPVASATVSSTSTPHRSEKSEEDSVLPVVKVLSSPRRRKKRKRITTGTSVDVNGEVDLASSDPDLDEEVEADAEESGRVHTGSCDSLDTPTTKEGMLQGGDSKSQNSDYGSFCNTPSDHYMHQAPASKPKETAATTTAPKNKTSAGFPSTSTMPAKDVDVDQSVMATDSYQRQPLLDNSPSDSSCSDDDAGANSSGYTRRKTRLHQRMSGNAPVLIDVEVDSAEQQPEDVHIPGEPVKTLLAFIFLFFAWVATTTSLALTHDRVPQYPPLPDVFLDNTTYQPWGLNVSEVIIMISTLSAFVVTVFHKHRYVVLRRIFLMVGLHYYYRSITMFITVLPVANTKYVCDAQLNSTEITPLIIAQRVLKLLSGFGLSINGKHIYCGDYIYSGHTMTLIMGYLVIKGYSPKRWFLLHYASFCLSLAGILFLLLARGHYSIDVIIAYWITTRLWWLYHTMCDNGGLLKDTRNSRNYFRKMWWWYIFFYFERNVPVEVPREYNLPIPKRILRMKPFSYLTSLCTAGSRSEDRGPTPEPFIGTVSSEVTRQQRDVEAAQEAS